MLDVLDVIAGLALALVIVSLALMWAIRTAWRLMCNLRDEEVEHAHTRRRLDDVEHLRRADEYAESGLYEQTVEALSMGRTLNHHGCTSKDQAAIIARRELVEAAKRPVHGGYPDPIKARDLARSRPHLKAVDAGGCAPPIMVKTTDELRAERDVERAYTEAGMMPVADYVAKHGEEPRQ